MRSKLIRPNGLFIKEIQEEEWNIYWSELDFSNYLQSWAYGNAKESSEKWEPKRFLILDKHRKSIAIIQILVKNFFIFKIGRINRGPLFLNNKKLNEKIYLEVIELILFESRKQNLLVLFHAFDFLKNEKLKNELISLGIRFRKKQVWSSLKIKIDKSEEEILNNFKSKWRNMLKKAFKKNINIIDKETDINNFITKYEEFQKLKRFKGVPSKLILSLFEEQNDALKFKIFLAKDQNLKTIGTILIIIHGKTATYTISWIDYYGRSSNANYFLLWKSILYARSKGCKWFDLGGFNNNTPSGIKHFKNGTNGIYYELVGESYSFSFM